MRVLRFGSTGPAVQLLQLALNRAGYGELTTDGIFGGLTREALRRFQADRGLAADGIAGPQTHRQLLPWYTGYLVFRVRRGDTVWGIAQRYGSSEEAILLANPGTVPENLAPATPLSVSERSAKASWASRSGPCASAAGRTGCCITPRITPMSGSRRRCC